MRSKFDQDDWLDDAQAPLRRKSANKPILDRAKILPPESANATVTELFPNQSAVRPDAAARPLLCNYRMSTLAFGREGRERSPVCVGDRVRVEADVITGRCERRNQLARSAPNSRDPLLHVLAANLDCLVVVAAAREPEFSVGIVDRFLVAAAAQKIPQVLCVNKADLIGPGEARPWLHYHSTGAAVLEASAQDGGGTDRLWALLRGKVAAFCGNSGVGKTSLLRRLLKDESYGRVGALSEANDKGRHTTSGAVMLSGPDGSYLIDTPGVMNFALAGVAPGDLLSLFPELHARAAGCGPGCAHDQEPACALRSQFRLDSYRSILSSIAGP